MERQMILELQYAAPIQYYARLLQYPGVILEQWEHYEKASYRNRCYIANPNGRLRLTIPLKRGKHERQPIRAVKIANDTPWQQLHWSSLISSYRSAPYFEYYEDRLAPFYQQPFDSLFEFNQQLMTCLLDLLDMKLSLSFSGSYVKAYPESVSDWRSGIHPKAHKMRPDPAFEVPVYHQVFEPQQGFIPNLSIYDLLFNEGPHAIEHLQKAYDQDKVKCGEI